MYFEFFHIYFLHLLDHRVEVGHGYPKLKNRENCLLTIIGKDLTMDLECFCFESFQENKVFAENWAMGLTYCIARAKGQIRGDSPVEGV